MYKRTKIKRESLIVEPPTTLYKIFVLNIKIIYKYLKLYKSTQNYMFK